MTQPKGLHNKRCIRLRHSVYSSFKLGLNIGQSLWPIMKLCFKNVIKSVYRPMVREGLNVLWFIILRFLLLLSIILQLLLLVQGVPDAGEEDLLHVVVLHAGWVLLQDDEGLNILAKFSLSSNSTDVSSNSWVFVRPSPFSMLLHTFNTMMEKTHLGSQGYPV